MGNREMEKAEKRRKLEREKWGNGEIREMGNREMEEIGKLEKFGK